MKYHPQSEIIINAPLDKVWALMEDFDNYSKWNTMVTFRGTPQVGDSIPMMVSLGGRVTKTPVKFLAIEKNKELRWVGGPKGLITGEHYFQFSEIDTHTTKMIQGEKFSGLMVPLLWPFLKGILNELYEKTNVDIQKVFS